MIAKKPENPVVLASGNKVLDQADFSTAPGDFVVSRTYSRGKFTTITAVRPDGRRYAYTWSAATQRYEDSRPASTSWITEELWSDPSMSAVRLNREDGGHERYTDTGRITALRDVRDVGYTFAYINLGNTLASIHHTSGRSISLAWSGGRISSITAPNGKVWSYGYTNGRLVSVTAPDGLGVTTYHYENTAQPDALTGGRRAPPAPRPPWSSTTTAAVT